MTPEQATALGAMRAGLEEMAMNLSVFHRELVRLHFTREEALELTKEWQRGFFAFRNGGHAAEEEV